MNPAEPASGRCAPPYRLRAAVPRDAAALAALYGHHVLTHTATFELVPPTADEMATRLAAVRALGLPWQVAESDDGLLGYAFLGSYRARPAYRHTAEDSVYVAAGAAGRGIGRALLTDCLQRAPAAGVREVIAVIGDSANVASIELHRRLGFAPVGTLRNVGWKFERWLDTVLMQWTAPPGT